MKIEINGQEVSYQLENEQFLNEIISTIRLYLFGYGQFIVSAIVDGVFFTHKDGSKDVSEISLLSIKSEDVLELEETLKKTEELFNYIENSQFINSENISFWLGSVEFWLEDFSVPAELFYTLSLLGEYDAQDESQKEILKKNLELVMRCLKERNSELENPVFEILQTMKILLNKESAMRDLSISLHKNEDTRVAYEILFLAESLQKLKRVNRLLIDSYKSIYSETEKWLSDIMQHISSLVEAFDRKDFVLVSDVAEYEIADRLSALYSIVKLYKEQVS